MAKLSRGKTFAVFTVFQPIAKVFPLNHLPCTVHNGMDLMHRKNFPVNSAFCAQMRKFSPSKVLPYTVAPIVIWVDVTKDFFKILINLHSYLLKF